MLLTISLCQTPVYGTEHSEPKNLNRLKKRVLAAKRFFALREVTTGHEALERIVRRELLRMTHECHFGVLALESEPVEPRLKLFGIWVKFTTPFLMKSER